MGSRRRDTAGPSWVLLALVVLLLGLGLALTWYQPDRPVATIDPGSSSGPAFVVQIIRPRLGLPLGGVVSPALFGQESHLGFDSTSPGATFAISTADASSRFEFSREGWHVVLVHEGDGNVAVTTQAVFEFVFQEHPRTVRCRPDDPAQGTLDIVQLPEADELSGSFDIELAHCEGVDSGTPLGWPPRPLVLHGSFDRLPSP